MTLSIKPVINSLHKFLLATFLVLVCSECIFFHNICKQYVYKRDLLLKMTTHHFLQWYNSTGSAVSWSIEGQSPSGTEFKRLKLYDITINSICQSGWLLHQHKSQQKTRCLGIHNFWGQTPAVFSNRDQQREVVITLASLPFVAAFLFHSLQDPSFEICPREGMLPHRNNSCQCIVLVYSKCLQIRVSQSSLVQT